eukprot:jgi/Ulvmu1/9010/UM005_0101.1
MLRCSMVICRAAEKHNCKASRVSIAMASIRLSSTCNTWAQRKPLQWLYLCRLSTWPAHQNPFPNLPDVEQEPELNFYDTTVEALAAKDIKTFTLAQMLSHGRYTPGNAAVLIESANTVREQLPLRLARRLLDLQSLPHIVVTNPYVSQVYKAYQRAFRILNEMPPITSLEENRNFTTLLEQLLEEHRKPLLDTLSNSPCHACVGPLSVLPTIAAHLAQLVPCQSGPPAHHRSPAALPLSRQTSH